MGEHGNIFIDAGVFLLLPKCSKHATRHQAAQSSLDIDAYSKQCVLMIFVFLWVLLQAWVVWFIAPLLASQIRERTSREGQWAPSCCGLRCASEPLVPSFTVSSEKWMICKGNLSLFVELQAVNLAEGDETLVLHSDQRRHRHCQSWETISSFSQHQKNVPSANVTTLKRTGKRLVGSLKWETDNRVLSLLWQDPLLTEPEKSNRSMNYRQIAPKPQPVSSVTLHWWQISFLSQCIKLMRIHILHTAILLLTDCCVQSIKVVAQFTSCWQIDNKNPKRVQISCSDYKPLFSVVV